MKIAAPLFDDGEEELLTAALVLLASMFVGRHAIQLSKTMEIDRDFCCMVGIRMRHSGRWKDQIYEDWLQGKDGDYRFIIDTLIAAGYVSGRTNRNGKYKIRLIGF